MRYINWRRIILKRIVLRKEMYLSYVKYSLGGTGWLGYQSTLILAKAKNFDLHIWEKTYNLSLKLVYVDGYQCLKPLTTYHILHTSRFTHFNLLAETNIKISDEKEIKKNLSDNHSKISPRKKELKINVSEKLTKEEIDEKLQDELSDNGQKSPVAYVSLPLTIDLNHLLEDRNPVIDVSSANLFKYYNCDILPTIGTVLSLVVIPPDRIASGSKDGCIRVWNVRKPKLLLTISTQEVWICALALLPENRLAGADGGDISIWNLDTGVLIKKIKIGYAAIYSLVSLPSGHLASGSVDGSLRIWDIDKSNLVAVDKMVIINSLVMLSNQFLASGFSVGQLEFGISLTLRNFIV